MNRPGWEQLDTNLERRYYEEHSVNINDAFPSDFLKADDIPKGQTVPVTMSHVDMMEIGEGKKPVLYFKGKQKGLILNKTNSALISYHYGPETIGWQDKPLELHVELVSFKGQMVPGLRVRVPQGAAPAAAAPAPVSQDPLDDDIPF